jgi:hypothetical protein
MGTPGEWAEKATGALCNRYSAVRSFYERSTAKGFGIVHWLA